MALLPRLIEPETLQQHLEDEPLLIIDLCSEQQFNLGHVPGAVHLSPAHLVCGIPPAAGRLPELEQLNQLFSRLGLKPETHVIAYDDEGGGWAGRLIWTLEVLGHHNWSYLNGGMVAWKNEGYPLSTATVTPIPYHFEAQLNPDPIAEIDDILQSINERSATIWDARSAGEYHGTKVLAQRGGHIPGALHCEWTELMDTSRNLRLREDALEYLSTKGITPQGTTITHCQTHHRSGFTYLAGMLLGFEDMKAYHGSWSEWGNHPSTPIEVG